jgi:hypothetical protein
VNAPNSVCACDIGLKENFNIGHEILYCESLPCEAFTYNQHQEVCRASALEVTK